MTATEQDLRAALVPPSAPLSESDPELWEVLLAEQRRQRDGLELIASENYVSGAVLRAMGSVLTNKYAEGYPGRRYYGGCEVVDQAERLAQERAKRLFGAEHANVQPHSGSQANMAVYMAVLQPGDTILAMKLDQGGHLTHGSPVNFSGSLYTIVAYGVDRETEMIDYDEVLRLAEMHRPKLIVSGASAYPRIIDFARLREIADSVGALLMADIAHIAGLIAAGLHPTSMGHAHFTTTTTHKTLRGPRGGLILTTEEYAKVIDKAIFPGIQGGPLMHVVAAKAVALGEALRPEFALYQKQIVKNAAALARSLQDAGLRVVSGGTDNHMMLVDTRPAKTTGKAAEKALGNVHITVNKNMIPYDPESPFVTSGVRIGTPAVTSRGMLEEDMEYIGRWVADVIYHIDDEARQAEIAEQVVGFSRKFPLPGAYPNPADG